MLENSIAQQASVLTGAVQEEINGKLYSIKLLEGSPGIILGERLIQAAGPAIGVALDRHNNDGFVAVGEDTIFTDIAIAISQQITKLGLLDVIKQLLKDATCNGQLINFETHFRGNFGELLAVIEYALKVNFSGFFIEYLKAKGLKIHTLRAMMGLKEETKPSPSSEE